MREIEGESFVEMNHAQVWKIAIKCPAKVSFFLNYNFSQVYDCGSLLARCLSEGILGGGPVNLPLLVCVSQCSPRCWGGMAVTWCLVSRAPSQSVKNNRWFAHAGALLPPPPLQGFASHSPTVSKERSCPLGMWSPPSDEAQQVFDSTKLSSDSNSYCWSGSGLLRRQIHMWFLLCLHCLWWRCDTLKLKWCRSAGKELWSRLDWLKMVSFRGGVVSVWVHVGCSLKISGMRLELLWRSYNCELEKGQTINYVCVNRAGDATNGHWHQTYFNKKFIKRNLRLQDRSLWHVIMLDDWNELWWLRSSTSVCNDVCLQWD